MRGHLLEGTREAAPPLPPRQGELFNQLYDFLTKNEFLVEKYSDFLMVSIAGCLDNQKIERLCILRDMLDVKDVSKLHRYTLIIYKSDLLSGQLNRLFEGFDAIVTQRINLSHFFRELIDTEIVYCKNMNLISINREVILGTVKFRVKLPECEEIIFFRMMALVEKIVNEHVLLSAYFETLRNLVTKEQEPIGTIGEEIVNDIVDKIKECSGRCLKETILYVQLYDEFRNSFVGKIDGEIAHEIDLRINNENDKDISGIADIWIRPIQRFLKYPSLFLQGWNFCQENSIFFNMFNNLHYFFKKCCNEINETKRNDELAKKAQSQQEAKEAYELIKSEAPDWCSKSKMKIVFSQRPPYVLSLHDLFSHKLRYLSSVAGHQIYFEDNDIHQESIVVTSMTQEVLRLTLQERDIIQDIEGGKVNFQSLEIAQGILQVLNAEPEQVEVSCFKMMGWIQDTEATKVMVVLKKTKLSLQLNAELPGMVGLDSLDIDKKRQDKALFAEPAEKPASFQVLGENVKRTGVCVLPLLPARKKEQENDDEIITHGVKGMSFSARGSHS